MLKETLQTVEIGTKPVDKPLEAIVNVTYRCNAHCFMCNIWKHPSRPEDEFSPDVLQKLPTGLKRINIGGGEPMLRDDYMDIVDVLYTKSKHVEISTNGYYTDRLLEVGKKYPQMRFRISIEGLPALNDRLRGIKDGFDHALRSILLLREAGVEDVGMAMVVSDRNCYDLLHIYHLCAGLNVEFSTAVMHNSWFFHKEDNKIKDLPLASEQMRRYILALLSSKRHNPRLRLKDWFRAYVNFGLLAHVYGVPRVLPCGAGTEGFYIEPDGTVVPCTGSKERWVMGNLVEQDFDEIWNGDKAKECRAKVANCTRNCWMIGTARPAMRTNFLKPITWVFRNKIKLMLGKDPCLLDEIKR